MMQPARRASLAAALLLLVAVGTASAECAWVLWEQRSHGGSELWSILKTYDTQPACRAEHERLLSGQTAWSIMGGDVQKTDEGFSATHRDREGKIVAIIFKRAHCLPDTIDPRGPKGR